MKFQTSHLFYSAIATLLTALISPASAAVSDISRLFHQVLSLSSFEVCQGGGCAQINQISINLAEWNSIAKVLKPKASNADEERMRLSQAIGQFEQVVGQKNGTSTDRAGTFDNSAFKGQLDCNDEAINTTTYMRLLKQAGLLVFHDIEDIRTRNFFFTGWPHTTAVIHDIKTGERYAVDSWFYDNGHAATVVPFAQWKANYEPADSPLNEHSIANVKPSLKTISAN
jgi:hypothetical protein